MKALKIIDELTGRILEGRRFGDGLHQALEAKETNKYSSRKSNFGFNNISKLF